MGSWNVYLICPVRRASEAMARFAERYVADLEARGATVHFPPRDVDQTDDGIGLRINEANRSAMLRCDEVHVLWDPESKGSLFDLGMAFMLRAWRGCPIVLAGPIDARPEKGYENILRVIARTESGREAATIREYEDSDWEAICRVHDRSRPLELAGSCDSRAFVPIQQDPEREDLRRCGKWVASRGDEVVGFVGIDGASVAWLYVDPSNAGRGIGRSLLRRALAEIGSTAWTIVLEGNLRARRLYESEGFRIVRSFEGKNAGYACPCLRMERSGG